MPDPSSIESHKRLGHDVQDETPSWYKPQPPGPYQVYNQKVITDIQRTLSVPESGVWDAALTTHIKGLQQLFGLRPTGIIDKATAIQIERLRNRYGISSAS